MHQDWARAIRDQCQAAGVPYFFKQWGEFAPCDRWAPGSVNLGDLSMKKVGKHAAGRILDGRTWDEFPHA
jgi:protein gp37